MSVRSVRADFIDGYMNIDEVVYEYRSWLEWFFYVLCYRFNYTKRDYQYSRFRSLKRGDSRYSILTCRKFQRLSRFGRNIKFYGYGSRGNVQGSGLHIVLEYDANSFSLSEAWLRSGVDFNRFMSRIRSLFGKVSIVRVFESHESGYPHIHVLLVFHEHVFSGYSKRSGRFVVYRVFGSDYQSLKSCWVHGFSNVQLVDSFVGGLRYLSKYLVKSTSAEFAGVKGIRGLSMCWVFHKRSFSMSGILFRGELSAHAKRTEHDAIPYNGNSNSTSYDKKSEVFSRVISIDLFGNSIVERFTRWRLFGFCLSSVVLKGGFSMQFVSSNELELCGSSDFGGFRNYYNFAPVVEPSRFSCLRRIGSSLLSDFF